jgi:tRNA pseudouridine13 synthase
MKPLVVYVGSFIRGTPEDFFVEELPGFEPSGAGEHLLLTVEKRGMNTAFAAKRIAEWAGVAESAIGYAGIKDRHAVTRQAFSVWIPKKVAPAIDALQSDELQVLGHAWHSRKLPRGALAGNRFVLALRGIEGEREAIEQRLQAISMRGVPNYFGEQRFGRGGGNVQQAVAMFTGGVKARAHDATLGRAFGIVQPGAGRACPETGTRADGEVDADGSRSVVRPASRTWPRSRLRHPPQRAAVGGASCAARNGA